MADAESVPSPCRDICRLDDEDVCIGCGRTIDEIARWLAMTDEEKRAVVSRLAERNSR